MNKGLLDTDIFSELGKGVDQAVVRHGGRPVGRADPMIAAIALQNGLELVTGNTIHYQRIQQIGYPLVLHDWRA